MAAIRERGPFSFQVYYKEKGKTIIDGTYDTKAQALTRLAEIEKDKSVGRVVDRKRGLVCVRAALKTYEDTEAKLKKSYAKSRKYIYQIWNDSKHADRLQFIDENLSTVTIAKVKKWLQARLKHVSPSTANRDLNELSAFFSWCKMHYELDWFINPVADVQRPRSNDERDRVLQHDSDEETKLIEALKKSGTKVLYPAFVLAIETAVRRKELCSIRWDQVHDLDSDAPYISMTASQTKTVTKRSVPLSVAAVEAIKELQKIRDYLKEREERNSYQRSSEEELHDYRLILAGIQPGSLSHAFRKARIESGVEDFRWHDSRHTAITRLFEMDNKFSVTEIQSVSGHKNLSSLSRYVNHNSANISRKLREKKAQ